MSTVKSRNGAGGFNNKFQDSYNHTQIEAKWQKIWEDKNLFSPNLEEGKKPFYNLMMFPYPSAEGLHVGNMYAFTGADIYGRFVRMKGFSVFEPIGLDGFGIHSENYALKVGRQPMDQAKISQANFYRQLRAIGNSYDFKRTLETYDPDYYKWTQWIFIQMFKKGLAVRKKASVNFCPSCKTVLSDEQVINGRCERCSSQVEKRELEQWFFKITDYAERLLNNIAGLNWSEKVKIAQKNWIGKSEGAKIKFRIKNSEFKIEVFTTRPDTLFGATFLVVAPEIIQNSEFIIQNEEIRKYIEEARKKTEQERLTEDKEKTGVFSGFYAINPVTGGEIPIWVADYILASYGTGAIMAVPAHDRRDFEFAKKYNLPIKKVVKGNSESKIDSSELQRGGVYEGKGVLIDSGDWTNLEVPRQIEEVYKWLEQKNIGKKEINYHLRDWLISRQRYWGPPIPMIYCEKCAEEGKNWFTESESGIQTSGRVNRNKKSEGEKNHNSESIIFNYGWYPVPEKDLPVKLPYIQNYQPLGTGRSPLANHPEFYRVKCPECGHQARRETDVSDTFLDSSWYFLRYPNIKNQSSEEWKSENEKFVPWDEQITKRWLPVNMYIGGAEHSVLHLLYARFVTMVFFDLGLIDFEEPFSRFFAHGLIIREGAKMSKSRGNVIVPDAYIKKYGADALRCYLMFLGPFSQGGDFFDSGIEGMYKFIKRVWKLIQNLEFKLQNDKERLRMMHKTIKRVTEDLEKLSYNTAIAALMEYYNFLSLEKTVNFAEAQTFLKLLAPFAPHLTEELYAKILTFKSEIESKKQGAGSIHFESWPAYDPKFLIQTEATVVVEIDGKKRGELQIQDENLKNKSFIEEKAKEAAKKYLTGKSIKTVFYVEGKIINFVTN